MSINIIEQVEAALVGLQRMGKIVNVWPASSTAEARANYEASKDHAVGLLKPLLDCYYRAEKELEDARRQLRETYSSNANEDMSPREKILADRAFRAGLIEGRKQALHERAVAVTPTSPTPPPRPPEPFETPNLDEILWAFGDNCRSGTRAETVRAAAREELRQLRQRAGDLQEFVDSADLACLLTEVRLARFSPEDWWKMAERLNRVRVVLARAAEPAAESRNA